MKRAGAVVVLTGLLGLAFFWRPTLPPLCAMKNLSGVACPGCGVTRSVVASAHGEFREAIRFHLFGPLVLAGMFVLWIAAIAGRKIPWEHKSVTLLAAAFVVALFAYWIVRLATGTAP